MNKFVLLASVAAFALSTPAFAAENEKESYKLEKTDAAGTTTTSEKDVKAAVDSKGNTEKTVTTKETTDPKGLMNKHTTKTKDKVTNKEGKVEESHKKTVDGHTVEETTTTK